MLKETTADDLQYAYVVLAKRTERENWECISLCVFHTDYAEENTFFFMQGPRGGPRSFYFDVINVF